MKRIAASLSRAAPILYAALGLVPSMALGVEHDPHCRASTAAVTMNEMHRTWDAQVFAFSDVIAKLGIQKPGAPISPLPVDNTGCPWDDVAIDSGTTNGMRKTIERPVVADAT